MTRRQERGVQLLTCRLFGVKMNLEDTIAAISTPPGEGGIGIIRISGPETLDVASRLFISSLEKVEQFKSHHAYLGHIQDPKTKAHVDQGLLILFHAPHSYTGEEVAEISCHGGSFVTSRVLECALQAGARMAEPGEFTLRAFLHGRIDLSQAEAVLDIIRSCADASLRVAEQQLEGGLSKRISSIKKPLQNLMARAEASIDFPDEVDEPDPKTIDATLNICLSEVDDLLSTSREGKICREGARVAIVGKPNVGKSSLMNALLQEARAIVTPISGTTRDVLEESASLRGIPIRAIDTAGIRHPRGKVEALGVERARKQIEDADLVLFVLDGSKRISPMDREILSLILNKSFIIVLNKSDLPPKVNPETLKGLLDEIGVNEVPICSLSAMTGEGIMELEENLVKRLVGKPEESILVANLRHQEALRKVSESLLQANLTREMGLSLDLLCIDLSAALKSLGEITGESVQEDLLNQIFSQFCIGK